jgi:hypothetical protein
MIASQILTPTVVSNLGGRIGVAVYDNPSVTDNSNASVYVIFGDDTYVQDSRTGSLGIFWRGSIFGPGELRQP